MEKGNSQFEHGQTMEQTRGLFCRCDSSVSNNTSVTSGNEFDVRSALHR